MNHILAMDYDQHITSSGVDPLAFIDPITVNVDRFNESVGRSMITFSANIAHGSANHFTLHLVNFALDALAMVAWLQNGQVNAVRLKLLNSLLHRLVCSTTRLSLPHSC